MDLPKRKLCENWPLETLGILIQFDLGSLGTVALLAELLASFESEMSPILLRGQKDILAIHFVMEAKCSVVILC